MKPKILIIDDDVELCILLKQCLKDEGYEIDIKHSGENINLIIDSEDYSLIILDVMLPGIDGFHILKSIREKNNMPVLMLSAKNQELDKVSGLKLGADDYLTKPFGLAELIARVNSLIRRYTCLGGRNKEEDILIRGDVQINKEKCVVLKDKQIINLTAKEFKLLVFLAENPLRVFTKKQIYQNVWEEEYVYDDNAIMTLIRRTRKKIEDNPKEPRYIQTVWGIGYRFSAEDII